MNALCYLFNTLVYFYIIDIIEYLLFLNRLGMEFVWVGGQTACPPPPLLQYKAGERSSTTNDAPHFPRIPSEPVIYSDHATAGKTHISFT